MRLRLWSLIATAFALTLGSAPLPVHAQSGAPAAVTGKVTSADEGAMEGVVVSAKKGIVTVSVVSNDKGEFSFPASKLGATPAKGKAVYIARETCNLPQATSAQAGIVARGIPK